MGWTSFPSRGRKTIDILKSEMERDNEFLSHRIVDYSIKGGTAYLLIERKLKPKSADYGKPSDSYVNDPDGTIRFIAVVLTRRNARESYDFSCKDMEECMGPYERDCPRRIIDKASPLRQLSETNKYLLANAHQWRKDCLERPAKLREAKANLPAGTRIKLKEPVRFSDGFVGDEFTATTIQRRGRNVRCFRSTSGGLYRIQRLQELEYTILGA
jgi:hypothetical protein